MMRCQDTASLQRWLQSFRTNERTLLSISATLSREVSEEEVFSPAAVLGGGGAGAPEARVFCTTAPARRLRCVQADPTHPLVRSTAPSRR